MLHDTLVEGSVVDDPLHPFASFGMIVELRTTVAGTDDDWSVQVLAKRFKDVFAKGFEVCDNLSLLWIVWIE